jgi:hypothetical protein
VRYHAGVSPRDPETDERTDVRTLRDHHVGTSTTAPQFAT